MEDKSFGLAWRSLNSFPRKRADLFYRGSTTVDQVKLNTLKKVLSHMKQKWEKEINKEFSFRKKTHFQISGGNVTFCFVLPHTVKFMQENFPHLPVHLRLVEGGARVALGKGSDIICVAFTDKKETTFDTSAFKTHDISRRVYEDESYLCAALDHVKEKGLAETLNGHNILFGRLYPSEEGVYGDEFYSFRPEGRDNEEPAIVSDQYFMSHLFMIHKGGIWHVFKSAGKSKKSIRIQEERVTCFNRFFIAKKGLHRSYKRLINNTLNFIAEGNKS